MTRLEVLGREVLAVHGFPLPSGEETCMLPGPRLGTVCGLPLDHSGDHEVMLLALVTIDRFTSNLENPMAEPDPDPQHAAEQRAQHTDRSEKPAHPRSTPTPRGTRPTRKPEQR